MTAHLADEQRLKIRYAVVTKATKELTETSGGRKIKGNLQMEIAVDAMDLGTSLPCNDDIKIVLPDNDVKRTAM
jgi:uncharacterized LabA/DUF88 family protein